MEQIQRNWTEPTGGVIYGCRCFQVDVNKSKKVSWNAMSAVVFKSTTQVKC